MDRTEVNECRETFRFAINSWARKQQAWQAWLVGHIREPILQIKKLVYQEAA